MLTFARTKILPPRPCTGSLLARRALDARLVEALRTPSAWRAGDSNKLIAPPST